jgi:hypothetical protein
MDEHESELTEEQADLLADLRGDVKKLTDERLIELITKLRSGELRDEDDGPPPEEKPKDGGL